MKKRLLTLFAAMAVLVCMLAACAGETVDTSSPDTSSAAMSIEESSVPEEISRVESSAEENSQAEPEIPEDAVELLFARYTSKPSFVMIGTCAQGAEITAVIGEQSVTVPSYMGWFTVTMKAEGGDNQEITFTQTIDGEEYDIYNRALIEHMDAFTVHDGKIYFTSDNKNLRIAEGEMVDVKITEALDYDLVGELLLNI